jgi:hypothetical protein
MKLQPQAGSQYGLPQPLSQSFPSPVISKRAPTSEDTGHPIGRLWVNNSAGKSWILLQVSGGSANWHQIP